MTKSALLVVAKRPSPGQTKTRLSPPLDIIQAARLYECFLLDTLELMRQTTVDLRGLAYLPVGARDYFRSLASDFELTPQSGEDLGSRLHQLTNKYLLYGYNQVVVMDSDSPTLPISYLRSAFEQFTEDSDVVIGPSLDGGYYLIGLNQPAPALLRDVRMSTPHVLADTLTQATKAHLRVRVLSTWYDVDDQYGLDYLISDLNHLPQEVAPHTRRLLLEQTQGMKHPE
jgi:rSAM/selenodomain-associated transferase 1